MTQPSQALDERQQPTPAQQLVASVRGDKFREQVALALPDGIPVDRFVRATVTALMANPDLASQADHDTIYTALLRSAQDGLVPDGREAAVVVYSGKAQYLPMVGGLRKIAAEHGWALQTACVYEHDEFAYELGLDPKLRHVQARPGADRGQIVAAYCVARHRNGERLVEVMNIEELDKIRATSKKATSGPWRDWTDRMYEKTVGKRTFAKLPLYGKDEELQRIQRLLADADGDADAAARMIYGSPIQRELTTGTPKAETLPADAAEPGFQESPSPVEAGDPQAGGGSGGAAAPAPGDDDEPEPGAPAAEDPDLTAMIDAARDQVTPYGNYSGRTLGQIADDAAAGDAESLRWLEWALAPSRRWAGGPFAEAVRLVVEHRFPALWANAQAKQAA